MKNKRCDIIINPTKQQEVNPMIFGQFIEFIENCIHGGIYDKGNPLADEEGIRQDVLAYCKSLNTPVLRYPGGTYINIFHWEDSIGPKERRKKTKNKIWGGIIDGGFGTAEFIEYCRAIGAEPMLCINMVSGTPEEAANWVEYCNGTEDTYYANLRREHGYEEPFNVKYWCIGNESMAVPDLGYHHDCSLYIRDAWEFTKFMKLTDETIKLIFVGDLLHEEWNKQVLDSLSPVCDYLSLHFYASENGKGAYEPFEAIKGFEKAIQQTQELLKTYPDQVTDFSPWYRFKPRQAGIKICLDEWNIWTPSQGTTEDPYSLKVTFNWRDALWVGWMIGTFIQNAEIIEIANMAQMVNVIAPIRANEEGSYAQTIYYPLKIYREMMGENRVAVDLSNQPKIVIPEVGEIDALQVVATKNKEEIMLCVVNISEDNSIISHITCEGYKCMQECITIKAEDLNTCNTFESNDNVLQTAHIDRVEEAYVFPPLSITWIKMV